MAGNGFLHSHFLSFPCSQFSFLLIPIPNFVTNSHSHGMPTGLFLFLSIPIPEQSFNRCGINSFGLSKTQTVHCSSLSLKLITIARITLYCITFQHNWTSQTKQNTPCLTKNSQHCFCHKFVKFLLTLIIFGKLMAKTMKVCKVHSFSTSLNLCQCTPMWNKDAPNCCIMLSCCLK